MTEDIKEILDKLKDNDWYEELDLTGTKWIELKQEETNQLLNYITNLQKENYNLKNVMFTGRNYNEVLKSEQDYKQRNEKAVEYIENDLQISVLPNNQIINGTEVVKRINKILNILQGGDE